MTDTAATPYARIRDRWQGFCAFLLLIACTLAGFSVHAQVAGDSPSPFHYPLLVAGSDNTAFNLRFIDLLKQELGDDVQVINYTERAAVTHPDALVLTLGGAALSLVQQQLTSSPTLALMITADQFARYQDNETISAVYYDPPLVRQALLGKLILPQAGRVALLVQPGYENRYDGLIQELLNYDLKARVFTVRDEESLIGTLSRALGYGDFLLATPDPVIFNPQTIKHILLTTYRRNRVVIGPGRAFVRAGVLASTFAPLEATARSAAHQINHYRQTGKLLPALYPPEFEVEVNQQVANSLNIPVPDEQTLVEALQQQLAPDEQGGHP